MVTQPITETGVEERTLNVYQQGVRSSFAFMKKTSRLDDLYAKGVPLADQGFLIPVCELHTSDTALIEKFAQWRTANSFAFPTQFPVTVEGTAAWLQDRVLAVEDRLLFLVVDKFGTPVGHLGYANALNDHAEMEIDNVVRGVKGTVPGLMSLAMKALITWAEDNVGPQAIFLRVFSDNDHAIQFYHKLSFVDDGLVPLRRHVDGDAVSFRPLEAGDRAAPDKQFLRMVYRPAARDSFNETILTAGPAITARETSYTLDAARTGWNSNWSGYLNRFVKEFADYVGVKYALPTASCTGALHIAMVALGIGPGNEVIVPDETWVATAYPVLYTGATPVFADISPDSWTLDPDSFESLITERTKAVIPVHMYGHPAHMGRIMEIARKHNLYVIEDAAPSIGAEFEGKRTGSFGHFAAFSFQGAKLLVSGEGGMLLTNDEELYQKAYPIWHLGSVNGTFWIDRMGLKYKMSNVQAALGLGQLQHVDQMIEAKRRIFSWYEEDLQGIPYIQLKHELPWARSIYWMSSIELDEKAPLTREQLREALKARKIDTRPLFPAISQYPFWKTKYPTQPVAKRAGDQGINLPSGVRLKRDQIAYVARVLRELLGAKA